MNKFPFVIWMLCWPLTFNLFDYISHLDRGVHASASTDAEVWVFLITWVGIGALVWPWRSA